VLLVLFVGGVLGTGAVAAAMGWRRRTVLMPSEGEEAKRVGPTKTKKTMKLYHKTMH
jgi:hypothetical protein